MQSHLTLHHEINWARFPHIDSGFSESSLHYQFNKKYVILIKSFDYAIL